MSKQRDVWLREVGTRDGLQSIATIFPTDAKLEWIRLEAAAGMPEIEVGSFVPPKLLPQMADSAEVVAGAKRVPGLRVSVLVPNLRGGRERHGGRRRPIELRPFRIGGAQPRKCEAVSAGSYGGFWTDRRAAKLER